MFVLGFLFSSWLCGLSISVYVVLLAGIITTEIGDHG